MVSEMKQKDHDMAMIANFPAVLQPIIQQGFLDHEFKQGLSNRSGFRDCAKRVPTSCGIGDAASHTDGTATGTFHPQHYAALTDLNMVTCRVGIASQLLHNAFSNGERAGRSLDELARNALRAGFVTDPLATMRPNAAKSGDSLLASDTLTLETLLVAVGQLCANKVPGIDGTYNCHLDPISARQLFADPYFRSLFQGATSATQVFRKGMTSDFLGLRFMPTTEIFPRPHAGLPNAMIRGVIVCGANALVEADFSGMTDLPALLTRLRAATGPDRALDAEIKQSRKEKR